jgi:membrane-bound lytic murein transglycosylase D
MVLYTARRGDTLVTISDRFGVSLTELRRWNHVTGANIKVIPGSRLHVAEPAAPPVSARSRHRAATGSKSQGAHPASSISKPSSSGKAPAHKSSTHSRVVAH